MSQLETAAPPKARRVRDQRTRLLEAIVDVVADRGVAHAKIGEISAHAGVSRATFYEYFTDKEACFTAAHELLAGRLLARFEQHLAATQTDRAAHAALELLAQAAEREPGTLRLLTHEALLAGPSARESHDRLLAGLEQTLERAWSRPPAGAALPAVPARALLGGTVRLCCRQLRQDGALDPGLPGALEAWVQAYSTREDPQAGRALLDVRAPASVRDLTMKRSVPRALARGRQKLPRDVVAAIQRERIAFATAEVVCARGGTAVAVSDIVAQAGVSREVFYEHFADKQQAFRATHQLIFEQLMAATASAYFAADLSWPERLWSAICAFTETLTANPAFASFAFVCSYGIGDAGVRLVDEATRAFGLFLEEGYRQSETAAALPRLVSDLIALANIEVASFAIRNGRTRELPRLIPAAVYVGLAPFIGPTAALQLLQGHSTVELEHDASPPPAPDAGVSCSPPDATPCADDAAELAQAPTVSCCC